MSKKNGNIEHPDKYIGKPKLFGGGGHSLKRAWGAAKDMVREEKSLLPETAAWYAGYKVAGKMAKSARKVPRVLGKSALGLAKAAVIGAGAASYHHIATSKRGFQRARRDAIQEYKGQQAKYGTVERATATRHRRRRMQTMKDLGG